MSGRVFMADEKNVRFIINVPENSAAYTLTECILCLVSNEFAAGFPPNALALHTHYTYSTILVHLLCPCAHKNDSFCLVLTSFTRSHTSYKTDTKIKPNHIQFYAGAFWSNMVTHKHSRWTQTVLYPSEIGARKRPTT